MIPWYENIPLLSYWILGRKCRQCGSSIPVRYFVIELTTTLAGLVSVHVYGLSVEALWLFSLISLVTVCISTDVELQILPDEITIGGILTGLLFAAFNVHIPLLSSLWGSVMGSSLFLAILLVFYLLRGYHGMGFGDVKMMAFLGAYFGFPGIILVLLTASLMGLAWGLLLIIFKGKSFRFALPFGAFLGGAALLTSGLSWFIPLSELIF